LEFFSKAGRESETWLIAIRGRTSSPAITDNTVFFMGLRGIEWVIFEVKVREKRGLQGDTAFQGMGYLAWIPDGTSIETPPAAMGYVFVHRLSRAADCARGFR
jgi:hypothetical protein